MRHKADSEGDLIARQSRRWELDRELMTRTESDEKKVVTASPVITISRNMGSGGITTGQLIAEKLNFAYYDKEVIEQIAAETGSSSEHIARYDERPRDVVSSMMLNLLDSRNVGDTVYLRALHRVMKSIAKEGRAVIVGRGGGCVLHDAVRVRLVAPFDIRAQRMAMVRDITEKEAEQIVLASDHDKKRFLRHFFGCDVNDPMLYDLVINTGTLSLDHAADLIVARVRQTWKEE
ncbi:MAG: cytidylate kinase-like family protein [Armatimonadota bacterium]